jgi:hypothetical protein
MEGAQVLATLAGATEGNALIHFNYQFATEGTGPLTWSGTLARDAQSMQNGVFHSAVATFSAPQEGFIHTNLGIQEGSGRTRKTFTLRLPLANHTVFAIYAIQPQAVSWSDVVGAMELTRRAQSVAPSAASSATPAHGVPPAIPLAAMVPTIGVPASAHKVAELYANDVTPVLDNPRSWTHFDNSWTSIVQMESFVAMREAGLRGQLSVQQAQQNARMLSLLFLMLRMAVWVATNCRALGVPLLCVVDLVVRLQVHSMRGMQVNASLDAMFPAAIDPIQDNLVFSQRGRRSGKGRGGAGKQ